MRQNMQLEREIMLRGLPMAGPGLQQTRIF